MPIKPKPQNPVYAAAYKIPCIIMEELEKGFVIASQTAVIA